MNKYWSLNENKSRIIEIYKTDQILNDKYFSNCNNPNILLIRNKNDINNLLKSKNFDKYEINRLSSFVFLVRKK